MATIDNKKVNQSVLMASLGINTDIDIESYIRLIFITKI